MKITKSYLQHIINEELERVLVEFDEVDDDEEDETQHIGGGVSKTDPGHFDYDDDEDEVFEETSNEERRKAAQRIRNRRMGHEDKYGDEAPADARARKAQRIRNQRQADHYGRENIYGDEAPADFRARKASEIRKQRLADRRPDHIRGKAFNKDTGEDEPYEEGLDEGPSLGSAMYPKRDDLDESDDWIQKADADIKRRGTKGRCTGDKFGSESCPEGSREYDLAKTFKKMARDRRDH